ncbi:unnamed protein product [Calypogeia fissa]
MGSWVGDKGKVVDGYRNGNHNNGGLFTVRRPFYTVILAFFIDMLEKVLYWYMYGAEKIDNYYMKGNYAPVDEFGPERVLSVTGYLPECLNGEFVRVGPNPRWKPLAKYHWFDGDGMLCGLRITDGKCTYVSRFVRTSRFVQEEYWGGPKIRKIGDLVGAKGLVAVGIFGLRKMFGVVDVSNGVGTANTAVVYHNGKFLSLCEADKPYAVRILEDGDFETAALVDYDKKLNHSFTAHPKIDAVTGEMFTFGYNVESKPYVQYRVVSKDDVMSDPVTITPSGPIMMHDFAITENYAIFMDLPLYFNPKDMVKKNQLAFSFDDTKPARFGVLPRYAKDESLMQWFELSTCIIFHTANAWEEGDEVILIACRSPSINLGAIVVYDKDRCDAFINQLWEFRFNVKTGAASERQLGVLKSDFPRINDEHIGRKSRYVYTALFQDATHILGVVKYDLTKEPNLDSKESVGGNVVGLYLHGKERYGSEPVYVPKNPGRHVEEDDGYVLTFVFDEITLKSEVIVLDAKTLSSDPVAIIELPTRVPYGFHAMFVKEEQLKRQTV